MPIYASQGVSFLWLLDPVLRTLEVFVLCNSRWSLEQVYQQDQTVQAVPFDAISFSLTDLWA